MIVIDFETRSKVDLKAAGTYLYVSDPSTDILCMALYNMETKHKQIWYPSEPLPEIMRYAIEHCDLIAAHNAEFDQGIYEYVAVGEYGFPTVSADKWYCTSARCRVNALPAALDHAAWALGLKDRKYSQGAGLIKLLSIPQADGLFTDPFDDDGKPTEKLLEMGEYCMQDVLVTLGIIEATRPMSENEHLDWLKTCEINERGIKCDLELATLALKYAEAEQSEIGDELDRLTGGIIDRHTQNARIKGWIEDRLGSAHLIMDEMVVYKKGVKKQSLDKSIRRTILAKIEDSTLAVPSDVGDVIKLLDEGNMSSVAKFKRMIQRTGEDHRVRGAFVFAGASQTLRYASRGVQLHNMKRECWNAEETENLKNAMRLGANINYGDGVMSSLSKLLRPALIPEDGKVLIVGDWSAIEGMVLPWLSNSPGGRAKLKRFKSGEDIYISTALDMGFTEAERQVGKVAELALGFSGGVGAFQSMARNYDLKISDAEAQENVDRWRAVNPWVWIFARSLHEAVIDAMGDPNEWKPAGRVQYKYIPNEDRKKHGIMYCAMPGGHIIQYPQIRWEVQDTPYGPRDGLASLQAAFKPKADDKTWPTNKIWPGKLSENITQAFAAAILRNAVRGLPDVIGHVHDEIIMEVEEKDADEAAGVLRSAMVKVPDWAKGLPLKAEPEIMIRYGK